MAHIVIDPFKRLSQRIELKKVIIGPYPKLFTPDSYTNDSAKKYSVKLAYKNNDVLNCARVSDAGAELVNKVKVLHADVDTSKFLTTLVTTGSGPENYTILTCKTGAKYPPTLIDRHARTPCREGDLNEGTLVNAVITLNVLTESERKGEVKYLKPFFRLVALQKIRDGVLVPELSSKGPLPFEPLGDEDESDSQEAFIDKF